MLTWVNGDPFHCSFSKLRKGEGCVRETLYFPRVIMKGFHAVYRRARRGGHFPIKIFRWKILLNTFNREISVHWPRGESLEVRLEAFSSTSSSSSSVLLLLLLLVFPSPLSPSFSFCSFSPPPHLSSSFFLVFFFFFSFSSSSSYFSTSSSFFSTSSYLLLLFLFPLHDQTLLNGVHYLNIWVVQNSTPGLVGGTITAIT